MRSYLNEACGFGSPVSATRKWFEFGVGLRSDGMKLSDKAASPVRLIDWLGGERLPSIDLAQLI